jgi:nucleotide-binding universal stress UspA family protein
MTTIVVGVDGSKGAAHALDWAMREARERSATLRVVYAAPPVALPAHVVGRAGGYAGPSHEEQEQAGERLLDDVLQEAGPDLDLERVVVVGKSPAEALIEAARDAAQLVVGTRGLGGFRGLVLGSVSLQCVTHASCPVTVVPPPD